MSLFLQRASSVLRTAMIPQARFHTARALLESKNLSFSELMENHRKEKKSALDLQNKKIQDLTVLMTKLSIPINDTDLKRVEMMTECLKNAASNLHFLVQETLDIHLFLGNKCLNDRNPFDAIQHFDKIIEIGPELTEKSDIGILISTAYYRKSHATLALNDKGSKEKDHQVIEFLKKALEFDSNNEKAKTLMELLQEDPPSFGASITRTLLVSKYNPNVNYY